MKDQTIYFDEVDDCIIAAYNHVKITGYKVQNFTNDKIVGLWSEDNVLFLMTHDKHNKSAKRQLARKILSSNIEVVDMLNKQLLVFL